LEQKILNRWKEQPPHYFESGILDSYVQPPEGWNKAEYEYLKVDTIAPSFEAIIGEMENSRVAMADFERSMFARFGLQSLQFPPVEHFTEEELAALVLKLMRLWAVYNFTAVFPDALSNEWRYKTLLKRMLKSANFINYGHIGIEFCYYNPKDCPFPLKYCGCRDF
jgi:hypothetical protein